MNQTSFFDGPGPDTLQQEIDRLLRDRKDTGGTSCRACEARVSEYRRHVHSTVAFCLIYAFRHHGLDWFKLEAEIRHGGEDIRTEDFPKCRWWDLVEKKPKDPDAEGNTSGIYRLTEKGAAFVRREVRIFWTCVEFRSKPIRFEGEMVDIDSCLGDKWSWSELMEGTW